VNSPIGRAGAADVVVVVVVYSNRLTRQSVSHS
jgi:hypothetical protein